MFETNNFMLNKLTAPVLSPPKNEILTLNWGFTIHIIQVYFSFLNIKKTTSN